MDKSSISLYDLIEYCQAKAIGQRFSPTEETVYRQICREYSKEFSTPLAEVKEMDPLEVILEVYENRYGNFELSENLEQVFDLIYTLEDPDYAKSRMDEFKDFIKAAEEEEEERQATGRPVHKALADEVSIKNSLPKDPPVQEQKMPQRGSINLSYLENEESDEES